MQLRLAGTWTWIVIAVLNLPILIVVVISFSAGRYLSFPPPGFSLQWYAEFFGSPRWTLATMNSFRVAVATVLIATPLGVLASFGLVRGRFPGRSVVMAIISAPLLLPGIVAAIAMYFFFARLGWIGSFWTVVLAHVAITVPVIVITVNAALSTFDRDLEMAAANLGANRLVTFWLITRPLIQPSILTGVLFAFLMSFDELTVSLFLTGTAGQTLPVRMWASLTDEIDPTIAAISTLLIGLSVVVLVGTQLLQRRAARTTRNTG